MSPWSMAGPEDAEPVQAPPSEGVAPAGPALPADGRRFLYEGERLRQVRRLSAWGMITALGRWSEDVEDALLDSRVFVFLAADESVTEQEAVASSLRELVGRFVLRDHIPDGLLDGVRALIRQLSSIPWNEIAARSGRAAIDCRTLLTRPESP
jgi:hypothetical protein